jgi:hypothetical protein
MSAASQEEITQEKIIEVVSTLRQLYTNLRATDFNAQAAQRIDAWIADHPRATDAELHDYFGRNVTIPSAGWFKNNIAERVLGIKAKKITELVPLLVEAAERKLKSDNAATYSRFNDIKQYYEPALYAFGYQLTDRPTSMKPSGMPYETYDYMRPFEYHSIYNKPREYPAMITWDTVVAALATLEELKSRGIYPNEESDASKAYDKRLKEETMQGSSTPSNDPRSPGYTGYGQHYEGGGRIRKSRSRKSRSRKSRSRNRKHRKSQRRR